MSALRELQTAFTDMVSSCDIDQYYRSPEDSSDSEDDPPRTPCAEDRLCQPPAFIVDRLADLMILPSRPVGVAANTDRILTTLFRSGDEAAALDLDAGISLLVEDVGSPISRVDLVLPQVLLEHDHWAYRYSCDALADANLEASLEAGGSNLSAAAMARLAINRQTDGNIVVVAGRFRSPVLSALEQRDLGGVDPGSSLARRVQQLLWVQYSREATDTFQVLDSFDGLYIATYRAASGSGELSLHAEARGGFSVGVFSAQVQTDADLTSSNDLAAASVQHRTFVLGPLDPSQYVATPQPSELARRFASRLDTLADPLTVELVNEFHTHRLTLTDTPDTVCRAGFRIEDQRSLGEWFDLTPGLARVSASPSDAGCSVEIELPVREGLGEMSGVVEYRLVSQMTVASLADTLTFPVRARVETLLRPRAHETAETAFVTPTRIEREPFGPARLRWSGSIDFDGSELIGTGAIRHASGSDQLVADCQAADGSSRFDLPVVLENVERPSSGRVSLSAYTGCRGRALSGYYRIDPGRPGSICSLRIPLEIPLAPAEGRRPTVIVPVELAILTLGLDPDAVESCD